MDKGFSSGRIWLGAVAGILSACGGSSDTVAAAGGTGAGGQTATIACALTGCEIAKLPPTASMPSGSATYAGRASVTTTTAQGVLLTTNANLALTADFNTRLVGVILAQIQNSGGALAGTATGSGSISGNALSATYTGPISGSLTGNFRGDAATAVIGEITIAGGGATGGDAFGPFFGNKQ